MNLPVPHEVFATLDTIARCERGEYDEETNTYYARFGYKAVPLNLAHIDELESLGWVDLSQDDQVAITERGRYWLGRFRKTHVVTLHINQQ